MDNKSVKKIIEFRYYIYYFLIYAFAGWLLESFYAIGYTGHFVNRGFLYGPLCPIYGYGALILICVLQKYKDNHLKLFFYSAIIFSAFEYFAGFALDALFSAKWWDYSNDFLNLNGRISMFYSFAWGIIALIFINYVHPLIERNLNKLLKKIPNVIQYFLLYALSIAYVLDSILSCIRYLV